MNSRTGLGRFLVYRYYIICYHEKLIWGVILSNLLALFNQFEPKLKKYSFILTRSLEDSEDLLSEVKIKIFEKYDSTVIDHFYSWSKTVMRNTHYDEIRKKYVKDSRGESIRVNEQDINDFYEYDKEGRKTELNSQKRAQSEEDLKKISNIVSRDDNYYKDRYQTTMKLIFDLPSNQREALMLHAEGYSYGEIAENLNIAKGTVMSTLCRAREKLTELLINDKDQNND